MCSIELTKGKSQFCYWDQNANYKSPSFAQPIFAVWDSRRDKCCPCFDIITTVTRLKENISIALVGYVCVLSLTLSKWRSKYTLTVDVELRWKLKYPSLLLNFQHSSYISKYLKILAVKMIKSENWWRLHLWLLFNISFYTVLNIKQIWILLESY